MNLPIAIQLYSVRDDMEKDFVGTIKKVKELGYDGVEFAGLFGRTGAEVKSICDDIDIKIVSAHVPYYDMLENPEAVLKDYQDMGCKYVVVPYLTEECRPGTDGWESTVAGIEKICLVIGEEEREQYALDILYDTVSEDLLATEIDTCWVNVGGEEPAAYVEKYTGRAPVVHLKDFAGQKGNGPLYKLIGIDEEEVADSANTFEFRPVGSGVQDWKKITAAAEKAGAEWVVVEQDDPSMGKTPMECAEMSINYLKSL